MIKECGLCGKKDEPYIIPWESAMGVVCKGCFDEIIEHGPSVKRPVEGEAKTESTPKISPEERKASRQAALQKAREVRSARAKEKADKKAEDRERQRAVNPEAYDAMMAKRKETAAKIQASRKANKAAKELTANTA
jgi:hypothetical protein